MKPRYEQPGIPDGTTFTCFIRRQSAFDFAWHFHREYELTLISAGSGTRYVGTTVERYPPGDLVLLGPDLPHTFASEPCEQMSEAAVTQFRHDFLGAGSSRSRSSAPSDGLLVGSARGLSFSDVAPELQAHLARLPHLAAAAQTVALLDVLRRLADATATPITGRRIRRRARAPPYATGSTSCVRYLQKAHTEPVLLAEVAALVHLSPTSFSRFFRRAIGCTLTDYVNQLRVETACCLC